MCLETVVCCWEGECTLGNREKMVVMLSLDRANAAVMYMCCPVLKSEMNFKKKRQCSKWFRCRGPLLFFWIAHVNDY